MKCEWFWHRTYYRRPVTT